MTFRFDELLVNVLPAAKAGDDSCTITPCPNDTHQDTTPCDDSGGCPPGNDCPDTYCTLISDDVERPQPKKREQAWREEQFALLARELDDALAR